MEYIQIEYKSSRSVFVDGNLTGKTNKVLRVEEGTHRIDLGAPVNYSPTFRRPTIVDTNQFDPLIVSFE